MRITKFRARNFKSVDDTGSIELHSGINILTGQNSVGKSALLELIGLRFRNTPHRSTHSIKTASISQPDKISYCEVEFAIPLSEYQSYVFENNLANYYINATDSRYTAEELVVGLGTGSLLLDSEGEIRLVAEIRGGEIVKAGFKKFGYPNSSSYYNLVIDRNKRTLNFIGSTTVTSPSQAIASRIVGSLRERMYSFNAQRLNIGSCGFGKRTDLSQNASNLPEVLNILQADKFKFERYNEYFNKIFPQIFRISIRPSQDEGNAVEILLYNEDPKLERNDLLIPLSESGTGVGQVLAMLYVVLTAEVPKIIIIDEPNSFLHPGAARKLIEILKEHPQHQFIIATHSPATISAANPNSIHVVKFANARTSVVSVNLKEKQDQEYYLAEIGAKLSDVFGADNILWVEGKTEEICFPKIIEKTRGISQMGTSIVAVKHTGDFDSKDAKAALDIYQKLSAGRGLLPPSVGFIFDKEERTEQAMDDLIRQSGGKVKFTKRRMFENYLLNRDAIVAVINNEGILTTTAILDKWMINNRWDKKYKAKKHEKNNNVAGWIEDVHAGNLLEDIFRELTQSRVAFDKVKHSVALCEWVLENSPTDLAEIQDLIRGYISSN